ncbi:MAG: hypothetical protein APF81_22410 [Desulfosporosinus sp. BRH_c37]|nr:MAG: hypothetical protein APF81_22410 [Desulfosporosinus sp. BRH_c37]
MKTQRAIETGEKALVGVNKFLVEEEPNIAIHQIRSEEWGTKRANYLKEYRNNWDNRSTSKAIEDIKNAIKGEKNMIPVIIEALKVKATMGEIHEAMRNAYGFAFR